MRTTFFALLLMLSTIAYSQTNQTHEYLAMTQFENIIKITKGSKEFEILNVKAEKAKDYFDCTPLLKRIENFEVEGWELFSNTVYYTQTGPANYVLMRRKK